MGLVFSLSRRADSLYIQSPMARYIFITGGVVSSRQRSGICSTWRIAAGSRLFREAAKARSLSQRRSGTMSPYQHGEVFVTDDGAETDLDLGHCERFTGRSSNRQDNITTGRSIWTLLPASGAAIISAPPCR